MVNIDKLNKSQSFLDLYARANPLPGIRAKVPLLQIVEQEKTMEKVVTVVERNKDDINDTRSTAPASSTATATTSTTILCESLILSEYVVEKFGGGIGGSNSNPQSLLIPSYPNDRAMLRLFQEICGSTFSYLTFLRVQNWQQLEYEQRQLQKRLVDMDIFLGHCYHQRRRDVKKHHLVEEGPFWGGDDSFTLVECNMAPFVQRCCTIFPRNKTLVSTCNSTLETIQNEDNIKPQHEENNDNGDSFRTNENEEKFCRSIHPLDICSDLGLVYVEAWIDAVLDRPSVRVTGPPPEELAQKRDKFHKRLTRIEKTVKSSPLPSQ